MDVLTFGNNELGTWTCYFLVSPFFAFPLWALSIMTNNVDRIFGIFIVFRSTSQSIIVGDNLYCVTWVRKFPRRQISNYKQKSSRGKEHIRGLFRSCNWIYLKYMYSSKFRFIAIKYKYTQYTKIFVLIMQSTRRNLYKYDNTFIHFMHTIYLSLVFLW